MREVIKRLVRESLDNLAKGNYKLNYMLNSVNDSYFYNDDRTLRFNIERLLKDYGKLKPHKSEFGHIRRSSDYDNLSDDEIIDYFYGIISGVFGITLISNDQVFLCQ